MSNSVLALRQRQIAVARREYKARGSRLSRCEACLLAQHLCICDGINVAHSCQSAVCLIMYHNESFKPSNTGRLIADIIPDNHAFRWDRTEPDPKLIELINDPHYYPVIVFPVDDRESELARVIKKVEGGKNKIPLYIFLDGTWREAKKMFRKSPYLDNLPILSVSPESLSDYQLRVAAHAHQLSTAEVACVVLEQNKEGAAAEKLTSHFIDFRDAYLKSKRKKF
ncbi:DTW domain-containing protein [Pseudoalteromonas sp. MMG013]|uniref:tRNA-uridine aminocarboxypropyltransferase n=1 Tax=unclassified Pseudoalteromonas TaxID=194690 RepID=UPI001B38E084|nr:DTW domain-containing protein [Pseudoalteromonas sp. MMG012]MBQ4843990.1 DTW domain-containing protein [Pseudoalteromonas sp. MMG005]MBQ4851529.1 DTW domain-containing protein [Pseudoalteromonas sp. MMG012]MBQ4861071.1 DTW domain-containing protein [Pseudoalteromonas sp. MMG013]